jgi:ribonuclease Z
MQRIHQIGTNAKKFDKLFLTHLHSDHTTGIPDLWITGYLRQRYDNPLRIWGPTGTNEMIQYLEKAFKVDVKVRNKLREYYSHKVSDEGLKMVVEEIDEGYIYEENDVRVIPFRVNHHDLYSVEPSLGFRIEYYGKSVVISGDTCYCENLITFSKGVDVLIHEVAAAPFGVDLPDGYRVPLNHHTLPEECGKVFSAVNPKLAVYYHIIQFEGISLDEIMERTRTEYDGSVVFGEDLMHIKIGDTVEILNRRFLNN